MYGSIFVALAEFTDGHFGNGTFDRLLGDAGLSPRSYEELATYPDGEARALLRAASHSLGRTEERILEEFGRYLGPRLLLEYGGLLHASWRTLDVVQFTESQIHPIVRLRDPGANPPVLRAERLARDEVRLHYDSPRRLCALGRGLVRGFADHFGEAIDVLDERCMHRGDPECTLRIRTIPRGVHA